MPFQKAQLTVVGIIIVIVSLIAFIPAFYMIREAQSMWAGKLTTAGDLASSLIIPFMILMVIITIIMFTRPRREEYRY